MRKKVTWILQETAEEPVVLGRPPADLPFDEFVIGGQTYRACFDLDSLEEAEFQLRKAGFREVDMLAIFPDPCMRNLRIVFAAAMQRFHANIPYEERKRLLGNTPEYFYRVGQRLAELWLDSMPKAKEGEAKASPLEASSSAAASDGSSSTASAASTSD